MRVWVRRTPNAGKNMLYSCLWHKKAETSNDNIKWYGRIKAKNLKKVHFKLHLECAAPN